MTDLDFAPMLIDPEFSLKLARGLAEELNLRLLAWERLQGNREARLEERLELAWHLDSFI